MTTKTPITVLQELMIKQQLVPHFDFLNPDDLGLFQCKVTAMGISIIGKGRNKKDSKQEAARLILMKLSELGKYIPQSCDNIIPAAPAESSTEIIINNVGVLKDLCGEFSMAVPEYQVLGETGLPHSKQFTIQCKVGSLERTATSSTKKQAKQIAAGLLVKYFEENMATRIAEFTEALEPTEISKSNELAKLKYSEHSENQWRPNLGLAIHLYPPALKESLDEKQISEALEYLKSQKKITDIVQVLENLLKILGLEYEWEELEDCKNENKISVFTVAHANPPISLAAMNKNIDTAKILTSEKALKYFSIMLSL